jgi:hypothetical protein
VHPVVAILYAAASKVAQVALLQSVESTKVAIRLMMAGKILELALGLPTPHGKRMTRAEKQSELARLETVIEW